MNRYRELFLAEAREHLVAAFELLGTLEADARNRAAWRDLLRHAHSLKGMAATMGFDSLVAVAHAVEEFAGRFEELPPETLRRALRPIADGLACMSRIVDRVDRGESTQSERAAELARELEGQASGELGSTYWRVDLLLDDRPARSAELTVKILGQLASMGRVERVDPPSLDLQTGRFEGRLGLILSSELPREKLLEKLRGVAGLQGCSLSLESRPQARSVCEPTERWVRVRAEQLDGLVERVQELRLEQGRLRAVLPGEGRAALHHMERAEMRLEEIYGDVLDLRLIPFETVAQRLHQTVTELARQLDKSVGLEIVGGQVRLDRSMLDELVDPLLHMVRNALDHGLESPAERRAAGKAERCSLILELERRGERVHVRLSDDGRGIDPQAVRQAAVRAGLVSEDRAARMSREETLLLTARTGLSTAAGISHVSGRGVGLDVVRDTVERLGGALAIDSETGSGTRVSLEIPLRMALVQTLLVRSFGEYYALPMEAVERAIDSRRSLAEGSELVRLPPEAGAAADSGGARSDSWVVVLGIGSRRLGLVVDEVLGRRELVVKPLKPPLSRLRPYSGASVLENGAIALVVDPLQLLPV